MRVLNVIGVGPGNPELVTRQAVKAIQDSQAVLGAKRALTTAMAVLENKPENRLLFEANGNNEILTFIEEHPEIERFSAVFTGDTSVYSGAVSLRKAIGDMQKDATGETGVSLVNYPGVSSIQYFLSKSGISMADVKLVSLHGRSLDVVPIIRENRYVCVLLESEDNAACIAEKLQQFGLSRVVITVGERLSFEDESFTTGSPKEIRKQRFDRQAIALFRNDEYRIPTRAYGISDERFQQNGSISMTRRDVRALSLCRLALHENSVVYDIGAGTGSVSIEAALACPEGMVISVESDEDAAVMIEQNRFDFQIDNIRVVRGNAPECFKGMTICDHAAEEKVLPRPDCVFIGGSKGKLAEIVDWAIEANPKVVIVINTVTLEGISEILALEKKMTDYQFEMVEIQATGLERRGSYHMHQAENPVTITRISRR